MTFSLSRLKFFDPSRLTMLEGWIPFKYLNSPGFDFLGLINSALQCYWCVFRVWLDCWRWPFFYQVNTFEACEFLGFLYRSRSPGQDFQFVGLRSRFIFLICFCGFLISCPRRSGSSNWFSYGFDSEGKIINFTYAFAPHRLPLPFSFFLKFIT